MDDQNNPVTPDTNPVQEPTPAPQTSPQPTITPTIGNSHKPGHKKLQLIILLLILIAVSGLVVYLWQHQKVNDLAKQSQSQAQQISQLQQQVKNLKANNNKLVVTQNTVKIPELGIVINLPSSLQDLTYTVKTNKLQNDQTYPSAYLSTKSLIALDPACSPTAGPIGALSKVGGTYPTDANNDDSAGSLIKQFPTFYIAYSGSQSSCSDKTTAQDLQTNQIKDLKTALASIQLVN